MDSNINTKQRTFTVNDSNGNLKEGIKHCFIQHMLIDPYDPPVTLRAANGTIYQAIYDSVHLSATSMPTKVIVSFQSHDDGNFAVIRNLNSSK